MIVAKAGSYTRTDLERAFAEYAEAHGHELAIEALERSTGATSVAEVKDYKIINGLTELICGFSFVGKSLKQPANNVVRIHEALAGIREKAFAHGK